MEEKEIGYPATEDVDDLIFQTSGEQPVSDR